VRPPFDKELAEQELTDKDRVAMTVRCAHCGEELLGAVNRCWKCGQAFSAQPTVDGLPPVRSQSPAAGAGDAAVAQVEALEARVLDDAQTESVGDTAVLTVAESAEAPESAGSPAAEPAPAPPMSIFPLPPNPLATPSAYDAPSLYEAAPAFPTRQRYVPPRPNIAALGGAYGALLLGMFALLLAPFRWEAAIVAFIGLLAGIWGIYSPRRGWAVIGMLLCAIAMGWGTYTGMRALWLYMNRNAAISDEVPLEEDLGP
jgi:hypothetical protein